MDLLTRHILIVATAMLGVAVLLRLAWRGRRVGEGVRCAKCEYQLIGLPQATERCPECGNFISLDSGENTRTGVRRRRWFVVVLCLGLLATGTWWQQRAVRDWFNRPAERKPTWLLFREARNPSQLISLPALRELMRRDDGLSPADHARLVDLVLDVSRQPTMLWGEFAAWIYKQRVATPSEMTDAQWARLFTDTPPVVRLRPVISSIEPFFIDLNPPQNSWAYLGMRPGITGFAIDGKPVKLNWVGGHSLVDLRKVLPDLPAGRHELTVSYVVSARSPSHAGADREVFFGAVTTPFDYRTDGSTTVEHLRDAAAREATKKSVTVRLVRGRNGNLEIHFNYPLPVNLCHDAYIRIGGQTEMLATIEPGGSVGWTLERTDLPADAEHADIILRPNFPHAAATHHVMKLAEGEIVYDHVPITWSPEMNP